MAVTITRPTRTLIILGDSISADVNGTGSNAWPYLLFPDLAAGTAFVQQAVGGTGLTLMQTMGPRLRALLPPAGSDRTGRKWVVNIFTGRNDAGVWTSANWLTALAAECDAWRSAGVPVNLCDVLPSTAGGVTAFRAAVNPTLATWVGSHVDSLTAWSGDATMGPDAAASNTSLYIDGTHPTAAGQVNLKNLVSPNLVALLA